LSTSVNQSSNPVIPSADQLAAARIRQWHQNGEALLTFENTRSWINAAGIALYAPRTVQLPSPAPSLVEAALGAANSTPTLADTDQARTLLTRLIAEGAAVPLNLLGVTTGMGTETPDYIVATAVLPYIFTLRGDKAWKQPPATTGPAKVSPLALNAYNLLADKITLSAYDLATQLGKEVTEAAVLRALTELWQHLRVLPIPQQDGAPTLWELTSTRFTKQLKAGANAGQPTALSALITLYLGQAIVATEEEIETFLSPLAARSRIRDVVHALLAARQLETVAVEGKTVLHVTGDLPVFLAPVSPAAPADDIDSLVVTSESDATETGTEPRIKKFIPTPRKIGTGFVTKSAFAKPSSKPGDKSSRKPFDAPPSPRERRPFTRESNRPDRPSFTKPWEEEKADRLAAAAPSAQEHTDTSDRPARPSFDKRSSKPASGRKPAFGDKPAFDRKSGFDRKPSFGSKRTFASDRGDSRPPRREFTPRPFDEATGGSENAAPRKTYSKPGTFGRKREGGFSPRPFSRDNDSRSPRREFSSRPGAEGRPDRGPRPDRPSFGGSRPPREDRGDKPFTPRPAGNFASPRYRKFDAPRGDRPSRPFNPDRPARPFNPDRPSRPFNPDRPSRPFSADRAARPYSSDRPTRSEGGYAGKSSGSYTKKSSSFDDKKKPYGKSSGGYAGKSSSGFAGKKPYGDRGSFSAKPGKPAGTFDKFKGNKKPFGNRPPARKWKPEETKSAE
jgi:23S rRNA pseudouridine2605 synthase